MNKISFFATMLFVVVGCCVAEAQDYSKMNLRFVYIAHENTTPIARLWEKVRSMRNDAVEVDDALIVYLADGRTPIVSFTNLSDPAGRHREGNEAFMAINTAMQDAISHDVFAKEDRRTILDLFEKINFVGNDGNLRFNSVAFDFYVGSTFFALGNNLQIIAHLFTAFEAASFPKDKLSFSVYKPKGMDLGEDTSQLFGDNNIDNINKKLSVFEY